jgi:polyhydroxyalkanoate synthase
MLQPAITQPSHVERENAGTLAERVKHEALTERVIMSAMAVNPLVALDGSQLLAAGARVVARALDEPRVLGRCAARLGGELWQIARGTSTRAPEAADRRFTEPAFRDSWLYRRVMQSYLAGREALHALVDEVDLDRKSRERGRFAFMLLTEALAPTNTLFGNPAALKRVVDTGGASLWRGLRQLWTDLTTHGGVPAQVDGTQFRVGDNIAATPGQVVFRNEVLELIQYQPATAMVREQPILVVPPQINKFYALDLAPGRSLVEYAVRHGLQVFAVSWRNVTPAQREWDLATYVQALVDATDVVRQIAGGPRLHVCAACAGGITTAVLLGHLAARNDDRIASATFMVTVLDTSIPTLAGLFVSEKTVASTIQRSRKRGVLSGADMLRTFSLLRPNDLVWNYWVNNYLLGARPPAFDILFWNNDSTNLPATLHAEFLEIFLGNSLCKPGTLNILDTPIDLSRVRADVYAVGALTDHITPWEACYRTPALFGGPRTFVASNSGHIQSIVSPPTNPKARYFTNDATEADPQAWLAGAREQEGTWWAHWVRWLHARTGAERAAPGQLGSAAHPPLMAAPGRYVLQAAG